MTGCADVCLDMAHDGSNEFFAAKVCTARKPHECCECGSAIEPKQKYERASGKSDGYFYTANTCALCLEVRQAFVCGWHIFGELWETISEAMFPIWTEKGPWDCLAKLTTPEAIALCNSRYAEWKENNDAE